MQFRSYVNNLANEKKSRIILALDLDPRIFDINSMIKYSKEVIKLLANDIIGIKINMHILLPLSRNEINEIIRYAYEHKIVAIADIKLNDIPNTNLAAIYNLAAMGFDALIMNPFMGFFALEESIEYARSQGVGVINLVYMSHKGVEDTYGITINNIKLYNKFLEWSIKLDSDGIVIGATRPEIIKECYNITQGRLPIYSPGVNIQGGDPYLAIKNGVSYLIVGRVILNSKDQKERARELRELTWI
jgi:orotidine-5'-phosphate decarboxylase